jgi:hypothetical protein
MLPTLPLLGVAAMRETSRRLISGSYDRSHFILDAWRTRTMSAALMPDRDFVIIDMIDMQGISKEDILHLNRQAISNEYYLPTPYQNSMWDSTGGSSGPPSYSNIHF